jgi:hypothetical protein
MRQGIPPVGRDVAVWANDMRRWLSRALDSLTFKVAGAGAPADQDGVMLWDAAGGYPVVSKGGEWRQIVLSDGYAMLGIASSVTAAAANTAYSLTWDSPPPTIGGLTVSGSEVTFNEGGEYIVTFTAQIKSSSASTVNFWFWPRINGADVPGSTMKASLHNNGATIVVARSALFTFSAGDKLIARWAVDSTSGLLAAEAATAFAPATPAATMTISRVAA